MNRSSVVVAVIALVSLAAVRGGSALAQEARPPAAREVLREKTVYVPYEKLKDIFEKEGRGIFLPYEEFLKLWTGQPKPPDPPPDLPPASAVIRGGAYAGSVQGQVARLTVTYEVEALKKGWSELALPLSGVAVESVELSSPRALFSFKEGQYALFLPEPGRYQARLTLAARVQEEPGKKTVSFGIPPVAVSRLELTIPGEELVVEVAPALAVAQTTLKERATHVLAFLGNSNALAVSWMPPVGRAGEGGAVLLAEQSLRAFLGERILKLSADIAYQVLRGEVDSFRIAVPAGTRLLSVKGDDIREWREEAGVLLVRRHTALKAAAGAEGGAGYKLSLGFERILDDTPPSLSVPFPRVEGVIRESGWVVLGHESGLNVRVASRAGLSQLDREEVPEPLRASLGTGFRYLAHPLTLELAIERILPVVRSSTTSVVVLGREEDQWLGWIDASIAKAGVFRLEFRVPARWSVASVGDPAAVDDFQTSEAAGVRTVAVSLKSKALGGFRLPFRLTAPGSASPGEMTLGPPVVLGSIEDRGLFGVSAPRAIDLLTTRTERMQPADVDALFRSGIMGQIGAEAGIPLTYGYREAVGSVALRLVARKTEVDVLAQHLLEISDGGIKVAHLLDCEILYAAADRLAFTAPTALDGLLKVEAKEKKEVRKTPGAQGRTLWEVILQAPALGNVSLTLTHELELRALESGKPFSYPVPIVHGAEVRAEKGFLALQKTGTLEIAPQATGLEAIDAGDLPDKLRRGQIYSAFRYFTPDPALTLTLTKYDYQPLATTVVSLVRLKSVLSEERKLKTRATLLVQNTERQYLELELPPQANIYSIAVAGRSQPPRKRKDGAGTLISIPASAGPGGTFPVVVVYDEPVAGSAMGSLGRVELSTVKVLDGVPVVKVELELYLPPDYTYLAFGGNLKQASAASPGLWSRFKRLVGEAAGTAQASGAVPEGAPPPAASPGGEAVDLEIPTRGYVPHRFETMAAAGSLGFLYLGRTLYSFIDFLFFAATVAGGVVLVRRARWSLLGVGAALVALPLVLVWFSSGAIGEVFTSILAGGAVLWALLAGRELVNRAREGRAARVAAAPDPYLEEAQPEPKQDGGKGSGP